MSHRTEQSPDQGRHAVVAVIIEEGRWLVIRRSQFVRAPGLLCMPGGGIEAGETLEEALHRELQEELQLQVRVIEHLWTSTTRWGTRLEWMVCERVAGSVPVPDPSEVAAVHWMTEAELRGRSDLLGSLPDFFAARDAGEV
jgi:8-oxo-dGTP diphosphatase